MSTTTRRLVLGIAILTAAPPPSWGADYVAFSLGEARALLNRNAAAEEVRNLAGINVLVGGAYDAARKDVVLVGLRVAGEPELTLDDLVVALRTVVRDAAMPLVSIDPTNDPSVGEEQTVHFEGPIADTQFGFDFFTADVLLKKYALGLDEGANGTVPSYATLAAERRARSFEDADADVGVRFWFNLTSATYVDEPPGEGAFVVMSLPLIVERQVTSVGAGIQAIGAPGQAREQTAEAFAREMTAHFDELCNRHREVARLRLLFGLTAAAHGLGSIAPPEAFKYWLTEFDVRVVPTPRTYDLRARRVDYVDAHGESRYVRLFGGVDMQSILVRLDAGETAALREAVLATRPRGQALTWSVSIAGWQTPWSETFVSTTALSAETESAIRPVGAFIRVESDRPRTPALDAPIGDDQRRFYVPPPPPFRPTPIVISPRPSVHIDRVPRPTPPTLVQSALSSDIATTGKQLATGAILSSPLRGAAGQIALPYPVAPAPQERVASALRLGTGLAADADLRLVTPQIWNRVRPSVSVPDRAGPVSLGAARTSGALGFDPRWLDSQRQPGVALRPMPDVSSSSRIRGVENLPVKSWPAYRIPTTETWPVGDAAALPTPRPQIPVTPAVYSPPAQAPTPIYTAPAPITAPAPMPSPMYTPPAVTTPPTPVYAPMPAHNPAPSHIPSPTFTQPAYTPPPSYNPSPSYAPTYSPPAYNAPPAYRPTYTPPAYNPPPRYNPPPMRFGR